MEGQREGGSVSVITRLLTRFLSSIEEGPARTHLVIRVDKAVAASQTHADDMRAVGNTVLHRIDDVGARSRTAVGQTLADVETKAGRVGVHADDANLVSDGPDGSGAVGPLS